jgi:hypothetical protein
MKTEKENFFRHLLGEIINTKGNYFFISDKIDDEFIKIIMPNIHESAGKALFATPNPIQKEQGFISVNIGVEYYYYKLKSELDDTDKNNNLNYTSKYPYLKNDNDDNVFKVRMSQKIYDDLKNYIEQISELTEDQISKLTDKEIEKKIFKLTEDQKSKLTDDKKKLFKTKYTDELISIKNNKYILTEKKLQEYIYIEK